MRHKIMYFSLLLFVGGLLITGCGKEINMDELAGDGSYHYRNQELEFSVALPPEFIYYQTQRTEGETMVDIDIFVPTNDREYPQLVPSYALPIKIRVFTIDAWKAAMADKTQAALFEKFAEKGDKVYSVVFWNMVPSDWQDRWTDEMEKNIFDSLKVK